MPRQERPVISIQEFEGLKTADNPYELDLGDLTIADNVDITRKKKLKRRAGQVKKVTAAISAAWANDRSMLYQNGTSLVSVDKNYNTDVVRTGLTLSSALHAYQIQDCIYYSNGFETGCLQSGADRTLGISSPERAFLTATTGGDMPLGTYQVAVSLVRNDGFESGILLPATSILLAGSNTAIQVSSVTSLDSAILVNYYVTSPNGDTFYFAGRGPTGATFDISEDPSLLRRSMKAKNTHPPLPFSIIDNFYGRMVYVVKDTVYFSDPFAYEQIDFTKGFIPFKDPVTMIGIVKDGIFIGTTEDTYFCSGTDPKEFSLTQVADYGVVSDTRSYLDGSVVGNESATTKKIPAWISSSGMCIGFPDGSMQNVSENAVILPKGVTGSSFFRQENGQNHFISVIRS